MGRSRLTQGNQFPRAVRQRRSLCPFEQAAEVLIAAANDGSLDAEIAALLAALDPEEAERILADTAQEFRHSDQ